MTEKIIVNPAEVRGLGNIVSPKTASDFLDYNTRITSSTDSTYGTVYTEGYLAGSKLTLSNSRRVASDASSFTVTATLKNASNTAINGATVYCEVNGVVTSGSTNSSGVKAFTITCDGSRKYNIKVYYLGTSSVGGSFATTSVYTVGTPETLILQPNHDVIQTGDELVLGATLTDDTGVGVPFASVSFFEEYEPGLRLKCEKDIIQSGDAIDLSAQLVDADDGSLVRESGHLVRFYGEAPIIYTDNGTISNLSRYTPSGLRMASFENNYYYLYKTGSSGMATSVLNNYTFSNQTTIECEIGALIDDTSLQFGVGLFNGSDGVSARLNFTGNSMDIASQTKTTQGTSLVSKSVSISSYTWYKLVVSFAKGYVEAELSKDGTVIASMNATESVLASTGNALGFVLYGTYDGADYSEGHIRNIKVY